MKLIKFSSFILFTVLFVSAFMPNLNAKRHTSFSFNLNLAPNVAIAPQPRVVEYYAPPQPAYTVVRPYRPAYVQRAYYPAPCGEIIVTRPYAERVYVQPYYPYP